MKWLVAGVVVYAGYQYLTARERLPYEGAAYDGLGGGYGAARGGSLLGDVFGALGGVINRQSARAGCGCGQ